MTTAVAVGVQARVLATAHQGGEVAKSGWGGAAGSGPTSTYLSRSAWRINRPRKQLPGVRVRRITTRCEASGKGLDGHVARMAGEASQAARAFGRKADQVLENVQGKAQRAAENANLKVEEMTQKFGIDEPLSQYVGKKGMEIRSEMAGTAESLYNSVVAISSRPVVKRSILGFLFFYAFSVVWAARILLFDKKSEEARERFGRELRLQKLREGGDSAPPLDNYTEVKVNGRKLPSGNEDEEFLDKVRKIQEMARAVRVAEQEVFSPSESGFVNISGEGGPISELEKPQQQQSSVRKDLQKKKKKQRKQMPLEIQHERIGTLNKVPTTKATQVENPNIDGVNELVHQPEPSVLSSESLRRPVVETPSAIESSTKASSKNVDTSQSQVSAIEAADSIAARSDAQFPLKGDVVPPLNGNSKPSMNGSSKVSTDGNPKPTPPTLDEVKLPSNVFDRAARQPVAPISSQPQKFKSMRVITSPEEARARIAARKAKDGNNTSFAKKTSSGANSTRPMFPRINVPAVELGTHSEDDQTEDQAGSFKEKDIKDSVRAEKDKDSQSLKGNKVDSKKQEPMSPEEEEEGWMRDEVLKNIVLKVRDNEEAGRKSFHGLDSEEEQKFFKGLERKFEREGETVKNWIQDRVENLDYGMGGVGMDDPPESFVARWKDADDPERAKRFAKFQEDRKRILEKQMGVSTTPSQSTTDHTSSASTPTPASKPPQSTDRPSSASTTSSPSPPDLKPASMDISKKDERLQSNANASVSKTIITSSGKQAKPVAREWQHTKKWAQELQRKYDLETDPEQRTMMQEVGQDLDRWITEDEIQEASRLLSQGLPGEQEYVRMHYEKTKDKIMKQHEMFGSEGMLNKYSEYKEAKKEVELWWLDLPYVLCIGLVNNDDNNSQQSGFYSLDMTPDFAGMVEGNPSTQPTYNHTVAFQDQKDALNFCGLLLSERYSADVIPVNPKDLYQDAKQEGFKVTVIKKGQLGLVPGQALDDVEQRLVEIGSSIYWEELERARSIDIDAVLDEGLGYGRPSR